VSFVPGKALAKSVLFTLISTFAVGSAVPVIAVLKVVYYTGTTSSDKIGSIVILL